MRALCCSWRCLSLGLGLLAALLAAGCGQQHNPLVMVPETDDPQFQKGEQWLKDEHPNEALAVFLGVIKTRSDDAPESHLEAGRIYLTTKNDPISAIYHFKAYLEDKPTSDQAPMVRELIDTAKKNFARSLPGAPNAYDEADLLDQIKALQTENASLRSQLGLGTTGHVTGVSLTSIPQATGPSLGTTQVNNIPNRSPTYVSAAPEPTPVSVTAAPVQPVATTTPVAVSGRTYTVQTGDTLMSISLKTFGTRSRWQDIYNANRDQLPKSDSTLHIGQVLKLPAK